MDNAVLDAMAKSAYTWNGALSYSTTGFGKLGCCLDYFAKAGTYTGRSQADVDKDMGLIFSDDESVALGIVFGLRMITRTPSVAGIEEAQTGYGRKDEFFKAVSWMVKNKPDLLYANLGMIPVFGCWKDFVNEPLIDVLDRQAVYALVKDNLGDPLLRKFLPTIRNKRREWSKDTRTRMKAEKQVRVEGGERVDKALSDRDAKRVVWAKGLCKYLGISEAEYRKLKSQGAAHIFQRQMSSGQWDKIHFNGIPGKAMLHATSRKGWDDKTVFERHGQIERMMDWVLTQKSIKFNGYPYELTKAAKSENKPTIIQKLIYDRQFETLLEPLRGHNLGNVLAALDTSGSMTWQVIPGGTTAYDVCISMGLCFSALNTGSFKDAVVAFGDESRLVKLKGGFCDRLSQVQQMSAWGSTNFQSVIDMLVNIRKEHEEIPVSEYPETLIVISDMQFNPACRGDGTAETNYKVAMEKLHGVGLGDMRIIWWNVNGAGTDFPAQMNDKGVYMISGFDPNNLKALMGLEKGPATIAPAMDNDEDAPAAVKPTDFVAAEKKDETPIDGLKNWLSQPIFSLLTLPEQ